jgi:hypothetical protein
MPELARPTLLLTPADAAKALLAAPTLLLTPDEAAKALRMSTRSLARLTQPHGAIPALRYTIEGKLDRLQPRRQVRYRPADLQAWIDGQMDGCNGVE